MKLLLCPFGFELLKWKVCWWKKTCVSATFLLFRSGYAHVRGCARGKIFLTSLQTPTLCHRYVCGAQIYSFCQVKRKMSPKSQKLPLWRKDLILKHVKQFFKCMKCQPHLLPRYRARMKGVKRPSPTRMPYECTLTVFIRPDRPLLAIFAVPLFVPTLWRDTKSPQSAELRLFPSLAVSMMHLRHHQALLERWQHRTWQGLGFGFRV